MARDPKNTENSRRGRERRTKDQEENKHCRQAIQESIQGPDHITKLFISTTNDHTDSGSSNQPTKARRLTNGRTNIVNLSSYKLTPSEKSLLGKGLNYIPTPSREKDSKIMQDYFMFDRKLRLRYHFADKDQDPDQSTYKPSIIKPSKGWTPPSTQDINFDNYRNVTCQTLINQLNTQTRTRIKKFNLTKDERKAMKTLQDNLDIVIKPADKGGAIVIQDTENYKKECLRQLSNKDHYRYLISNPVQDLNKKIHSTLTEGLQKGLINQEEFEALYNKYPRTSNFYCLPKIHKENNPGRPIVNSIGSITEKISCYVDEQIKDLVKLVPSYIKDTSHFLQEIEKMNVDEEDILVTVDVSALYTNILHQEGLTAMKNFMENNGTPKEHSEFITKLASLVLKSNYFEFDNKIYYQKQGTAMGTKMAPNYAIIYMHWIETGFLQSIHHKPKIWKRFIDDIFMLWPHGEHKLQELLTALNSYHKVIKFTEEHSTTEIPFLDTTVYKIGNKLATKVYHKKTDQKAYLHYNSAHPRNQKDAIPYSLMIRSRRICTEELYFKQEATMLIRKLMQRNYPKILLLQAYLKARSMDRHTLIHQTTKRKQEERIRYITTYNHQNPPIKQILERNKAILERNRKGIIYKELQVVYRRAPNLRDKLIKGQIQTKKQQKKGITKPCNKPCVTCNLMETSNTITTKRNVSYKIEGKFDCQSHHVVYVMTCKHCQKQYVGETMNRVNLRIGNHKSCIKTKRDNPVANHFNEIHDTTTPDFTVKIVSREENKNKRLRLEEAWISILDTFQPEGLNNKW